ncbi:MAG: PilN domain-containing protein [Ignavibacteriota bacterium]
MRCNALTKLIEPPAWVNNTTLSRDFVMISGEAPQAAPLLRILDSSPLFGNSAFQANGRAQNGMESFQIRSGRKYPAQ